MCEQMDKTSTTINLEGLDATSASVINVKAGDVVVLMVEQALSMDQQHAIRAMLGLALPSGVKSLILDRGAKVAVLSS